MSGFAIPKGADYVCMKCGKPFRWFGNPPRLTALAAIDKYEDDDDDG
jgi:DNA-directed RNA polymerase subunit RPC12/RpoP